MPTPDANAHAKALFDMVPKGTVAELLAIRFTKEYERGCSFLRSNGTTDGNERGGIDKLHDLYVTQLANLLHPIGTPAGNVGELVSFYAIELVQALERIVAAWRAVNPIGWVAAAKGDPKELIGAVRDGAQLIDRIKDVAKL